MVLNLKSDIVKGSNIVSKTAAFRANQLKMISFVSRNMFSSSAVSSLRIDGCRLCSERQKERRQRAVEG